MAAGDPVSYLTLQPGTVVLTSDGERMGVVEHVLRDDAANIFDGIVVDAKAGPGGHRFVDAPEVAEMREDAVVLTISAEEARSLPDPGGNPPAMEHHGAEDAESPLQGKLRRAWALISGKRPDDR